MEIIKSSGGKRFSMKVVSNRTGLSAHAIRAWERRYGAVSPGRDANNRRFYSQSDIERLSMLKLATEAGFSIGQIADYSEEDLREILDKLNVIELPVNTQAHVALVGRLSSVKNYGHYIESFIAAAEQMDSKTLESIIVSAETELGINSLIENFITPLLAEIGALWRSGELRIANEHMASHVIRTYLGSVLGSHNNNPAAPSLVASTPVGQWHDLGSLIAAVIASTEGWHVHYLGSGLPAEEIAGAARYSSSGVVALSLIYPSGDPTVMQELRKLKRSLNGSAKIIVTGGAKDSYDSVLKEIGAVSADNLGEFRNALELLR